jgi:hypothetical protein
MEVEVEVGALVVEGNDGMIGDVPGWDIAVVEGRMEHVGAFEQGTREMVWKLGPNLE